MILVNLYGAPGAGKSTGAAYIFSQLKMRGINAELVTEFAKDKVWEESKEVFNNQAYIFGKQYFRISRCTDKVDVIITDSPLLLSTIYNDNPILGEEFNNVVRNVANSYDSINYYITRVKEYNPKGRFQSEEESDAIADRVKDMLDYEGVEYIEKPGSKASYDEIYEEVLETVLVNEILNSLDETEELPEGEE